MATMITVLKSNRLDKLACEDKGKVHVLQPGRIMQEG